MSLSWWELGSLTVAAPALGGYFLQSSAYLVALLAGKKDVSYDRSKRVAILMAARNEEDNILDALESLEALDYPKELLDIWIADDHSDDRTGELVKQFIAGKSHFNYYLVDHQYDGVKGKQNALACLAHKAQGDYLMIVDADIIVPRNWVATMMGEFDANTGMVCGVTVAKGTKMLDRMQALDWLWGSAMFKGHADLGFPLSGLGNNMAMTREAYEAVGGFESLKFCVNEDFRIFKEMCEKRDFGYKQVLHPDAVNTTQPITSFAEVMMQRRRWVKGAKDLISYNKVFLALPSMVLPMALLLGFTVSWWLALGILAVKFVLGFCVQLITAARTDRLDAVPYFPLWEIYYPLVGLAVPIALLRSKKVTWKGRKF